MAKKYEKTLADMAKKEEAKQAQDREVIEKYVKARVAMLQGSERQKIKEEIMKRVEKSKEKEASVKPKESKTGDKGTSRSAEEAKKDLIKEKQECKKPKKETCGEEKAESCACEEDQKKVLNHMDEIYCNSMRDTCWETKRDLKKQEIEAHVRCIKKMDEIEAMDCEKKNKKFRLSTKEARAMAINPECKYGRHRCKGCETKGNGCED